jgi:hypothetical protein
MAAQRPCEWCEADVGGEPPHACQTCHALNLISRLRLPFISRKCSQMVDERGERAE